ncbi:MAG: NAD(+) synthase [Oscillospiraceae bacterium]|nr:NAD(+) synthase [Oscillospiraceae bacterium]
MITIYLPPDFEPQREIASITADIREGFSGASGAVIGMSGGKDSSVAARLLADALGAGRVFGVIIPNGRMADEPLARKICEHLGIEWMRVDIGPVYQSALEALGTSGIPDFISAAAQVNILPRLRMTVLYALAQSRGYRVAGTGNLSERMVGYCTKWGDMASDYNPLGHYTCSEVVAIGRALLPDWIIERVPEDGLQSRTDEENLGFTYAELDKLIRTGEEGARTAQIRRRVAASAHKRLPVPSPKPVFDGAVCI